MYSEKNQGFVELEAFVKQTFPDYHVDGRKDTNHEARLIHTKSGAVIVRAVSNFALLDCITKPGFKPQPIQGFGL